MIRRCIEFPILNLDYIDMETIKSPMKKDLEKDLKRANDIANRLKDQPCNYVYRYERDETAKLLKKLIEFVDQVDVLVTQCGQDQTNRDLLIDDLKKKIKDTQQEIQESQNEIERQKRLQALFAKFGKRNMQLLIAFLKEEFKSKGYKLLMNSDDFESQFHKYVTSLPQPDIDFLTTEFAKLQTIDQSDDNIKDLEPFHTSMISSTVSVIGDGEHIGSQKHYDK